MKSEQTKWRGITGDSLPKLCLTSLNTFYLSHKARIPQKKKKNENSLCVAANLPPPMTTRRLTPFFSDFSESSAQLLWQPINRSVVLETTPRDQKNMTLCVFFLKSGLRPHCVLYSPPLGQSTELCELGQ